LAIGDWDPPPSTDELVQRLRDGITEGAVVLMHDGPASRANTVDAVARIIPELRRAGYRFDRPAR
ncbi:MAG: polysaccharide deacetylase family protein, partial [Saccharothrix sp.]|nr:polysaccharide deacetylase family protein [Saccharothrix sp.]